MLFLRRAGVLLGRKNRREKEKESGKLLTKKRSESKVLLFCLLACALIIEGGTKAWCLCCLRLCLFHLIQTCINITRKHTQTHTGVGGWRTSIEKYVTLQLWKLSELLTESQCNRTTTVWLPCAICLRWDPRTAGYRGHRALISCDITAFFDGVGGATDWFGFTVLIQKSSTVYSRWSFPNRKTKIGGRNTDRWWTHWNCIQEEYMEDLEAEEEEIKSSLFV